jgi:hypothetical protein
MGGIFFIKAVDPKMSAERGKHPGIDGISLHLETFNPIG